MTDEKKSRLVAMLRNAEHRYRLAREMGDNDGARYAQAEVKNLRRILFGE